MKPSEQLEELLVRLNQYCQENNIGKWGDSSILSLIQHCEKQKAELQVMKALVAVHESNLPNLTNKADTGDRLYLPFQLAVDAIISVQDKSYAAGWQAGYVTCGVSVGGHESTLRQVAKDSLPKHLRDV